MSRIFISYRRDDSGYATDTIYKYLCQTLDPSSIFFDINGIPLGVNWEEYLSERVSDCSIMLVVIGKDWLTISDRDTGERRLNQDKDVVRYEIEQALVRDIVVIPIFLDGLRSLPESELPKSIKALSKMQGLQVRRGLDFDVDVERLAKHLKIELDKSDEIQFFSAFITYSNSDKEFARLLHARLQGQGIRCWLDEHQLKPGDKLHPTIYEAIRVYDKLILCCSVESLTSWWVNKEFENVMGKEESYATELLIPVDLDGYVLRASETWVVGEIKKRYVQSFVGWKDHATFEAAFAKVVKALRMDGGSAPSPEPKLKPKRPR